MLLLGRLNVEKMGERLTKLLMHGGMPLRLINLVILIVCYAPSCCKGILLMHRAVAITALTQTITHLTKNGRFRQAADREKEIGQLYLQHMHDLRKACESMVRAGEWYAQEDATA